MSITRLVDKIRRVDTLVHEAKLWVARDPESLSARFSLLSIEKHRAQVAEELKAAQATSGQEVCRYRYLVDWTSLPIRPLVETLGAFQDLVSLSLSSVYGKPLPKGHSPLPEIVQQATVGLAYCFDGSIGLGLFGPELPPDLAAQAEMESDFSKAIRQIVELGSSESSRQVSAMRTKLGLAMIAKFHNWAKLHISYAIPVELAWTSRAIESGSRAFSIDDLTRITHLIAAVHDSTLEQFRAVGTLTKADAKSRRFTVEVQGKTISGEIGVEVKLGDLRFETVGEFFFDVRTKINLDDEAADKQSKFTLLKVTWIET